MNADARAVSQTPSERTRPMPSEYWNDPSLRLVNGSTDEKYEQKTKKKATVPHNYVSDLQKDLIVLGYLKTGADTGKYGPETERAVKRFQRHALRKFRWNGTTKSTVTGWVGTVTGICDPSTAKEVRAWIDNKYRLPLKVFQMTKFDGDRQMREDAAKVWQQAVKDATAKGATLLPPFKDTKLYYGD